MNLIEKYKIYIVYAVSLAFIVLNCYLIIQDKYYALLTPILLIFLFLYIFSLDKLILFIVFLTPIAVNYKDPELGVGISLPTEPIMLGVLVIFILKLFYEGGFNKKVVNHPVSIFIIINLIWLTITTFTSEIPLVSAKFLIARLWFIVPFYFIGILIFKKLKNIKLFNWLYILPLIIVILYTLFNHAGFGFDKPSSNMVMKPFYNDHTAYGAVLSMFLPFFIGFSFSKSYSNSQRLTSFIVLFILVTGVIFSYSRAAWISIAFAIMVYGIIVFKIKFRWVLVGMVILAGMFYMFSFQLIDKLERNKQDSSTDFVEHIQSMSNISSDASNLERINRWNCAIRLYKERPFWGWGPGTYQFIYAPYQRSKEKTIISTNAGDMGNAHSEYIGPLSESGILGMLSFIAIVIAVTLTGLRVYKRAESKEVKLISLVILLGLMTYFAHGLLNNFLDTDKAAVPFWGFIGILVSLDLYHTKKKGEDPDT
ncbi:MAG: O-antigen ligase family protein [Bacteroidales bacterium]|nr:O-antigen ligase family protein [Bacteroidales bacterium]